MLEQETRLFETKLPDFIKTELGKFVLIKGENIFGTYETIGDALKSGYEKFKDQPFFVKQILIGQHPLNFANNFLLK